MHDPEVVVYDVPSPFPQTRCALIARPPFYRKRYVGEGPLVGTAIYPWYRPAAWGIQLRGKRVVLRNLLTIWHVEPDGCDALSICKGMPSDRDLLGLAAWTVLHRGHLRIRWNLGWSTWRWLTKRCWSCGRRLGRKEGWFGTGWDSGDSGHQVCVELMAVKNQRQDALRYAMGIASDTERWRVEYFVKDIAERFAIEEMGISPSDAHSIRDAAQT